MPARKAEDRQRRGHSLRHDLSGLRELRRGLEDLPLEVP